MKFVCEASAISDALNRAKSILELSATSEAVAQYYLLYSASKFEIGGECQAASIVIDIEGKNNSAGAGAVCIGRDDVLGILKGRKEVELSLDGTLLKIKAGRYNATLPTKEVNKEQLALLKIESGKGTALKEDALAALKQAIELTTLSDVYFGNPLNNYVYANDGLLSVSCYDNCHFAQYRAQVKIPNLQVAIPNQYFSALWKFTKGGISIDMSGSSFIAYGEGFRIRLPSVQATDENFQLVDLLLQDIRVKYSTKVFTEDLHGLVQNMFTLFEPGSGFHFRGEGQQISVEIKSGKGTASEEIRAGSKTKGSVDCMVDPRLLRELIPSKATKSATLQVEPKQAMLLKYSVEDSFTMVAGTQLI